MIKQLGKEVEPKLQKGIIIMKICVFDTETTSLEKPFCYNVGFIIGDTETGEIVTKQEFVVEQIWHNMELFNTAYYANKRPIYVKRMRARQIVMDKWGYICQRMRRIFKEFNVSVAYAYNSDFDEKVFNFNCDWFKTSNPFDEIPIFDIRGLVHQKIAWSKPFQDFCERNKRFTESGNYSTTAETLFQFFSNDTDFEEEHTALADSLIEWEIAKECIKEGLQWGVNYKVYASIPRQIEKHLEITTREKETFIFDYQKIRISKDKTKIVLK